MNKKPRLAIIGIGNVGATLATATHQSGAYEVVLGARDIAKAQAKIAEAGLGLSVASPATAAAMADIVLVTVSDQAIRAVCEQLAPVLRDGAVVAHCSGALTSDELTAANNVHRASMHPLQSFPNVMAGVANLPGTWCYQEGDALALAELKRLCDVLSMRSVVIEKTAKVLYHASAVMACNYFSALMDAALEVAELAGIERDTMWQSLQPLVAATLGNVSEVGARQALTGPIMRADTATVAGHLQALTEHGPQSDGLAEIYTALGQQAVSMMEGRLPEERIGALRNVLSQR